MTEKEYNLKGQTPKQVFCDIIGSNTVYVPQNEEIKEVFGKFKELYPLYEKTAQNRFESQTVSLTLYLQSRNIIRL